MSVELLGLFAFGLGFLFAAVARRSGTSFRHIYAVPIAGLLLVSDARAVGVLELDHTVFSVVDSEAISLTHGTGPYGAGSVMLYTRKRVHVSPLQATAAVLLTDMGGYSVGSIPVAVRVETWSGVATRAMFVQIPSLFAQSWSPSEYEQFFTTLSVRVYGSASIYFPVEVVFEAGGYQARAFGRAATITSVGNFSYGVRVYDLGYWNYLDSRTSPPIRTSLFDPEVPYSAAYYLISSPSNRFVYVHYGFDFSGDGSELVYDYSGSIGPGRSSYVYEHTLYDVLPPNATTQPSATQPVTTQPATSQPSDNLYTDVMDRLEALVGDKDAMGKMAYELARIVEIHKEVRFLDPFKLPESVTIDDAIEALNTLSAEWGGSGGDWGTFDMDLIDGGGLPAGEAGSGAGVVSVFHVVKEALVALKASNVDQVRGSAVLVGFRMLVGGMMMLNFAAWVWNRFVWVIDPPSVKRAVDLLNDD